MVEEGSESNLISADKPVLGQRERRMRQWDS